MADITELLNAVAEGKAGAQDALLEAVYSELRMLASSSMRRERVDHTLQTTALVNEAYLRLLGDRKGTFHNRAHFFVAASQTMRRILIDYARKHAASKRTGGRQRVDLESVAIAIEEQADDLVALDTALEKLAALDPRLVKVVELRFFTGMNVEETAKILGTSDTTVKRDWALARAFLEKEIRG